MQIYAVVAPHHPKEEKNMGKIIRYAIYFLIAVAVYVLVRGILNGSINAGTTIGQAATEVSNGSMQTLENMKNDASSAINRLTEQSVQKK